MKNIPKPFVKILKTMGFTLLWCYVWIILEYIIYGHVESRIVDNIMTLIVIPIIYKAVN